MLTIRAKTGECGPLQEALLRRLNAAAVGEDGPEVMRARWSGALVDDEIDVDLATIAEVMDQLRVTVAPGQPRDVTGPTPLLDPVIRAAAGAAVERLREVVAVFSADRGQATADEVRAALDTAHASVSTLIALDHVQNHAVE